MTAGQLRLLAFVGGHLRSARENLRMLTLLEEKQKSLEQNLQAVKLEQQMLKVLCKDSTSIYRVDLMNDRAEIVKIEEHSNSAGDLLPHGQELFSYAEAVEHYYHKCVLKESAPDFLQFLDAENLMRELRTKERVSRRYQSVPNAIGNIYFEERANTAEQLRGYRVHCVRAVNGQDCLQRIEQAAPDEFDAILMDMQMPVMNGLEATAAIRKLDSETAKNIPIIALIANAYHEDIQKCLAAGMNAHLSKPINIDRAVRTIIECARTAKENG